MMMNEESKEILKKAGWYEGRKIDLTKIKSMYAKYQKTVFSKAEELLEEFGCLEIKAIRTSAGLNIEKMLENDYFDGMAEELEIVLNEKVLMIGECFNGYESLYISEVGNIYTDYGLIGDNPYDFWNHILKTFTIYDKNNKLVTWKELGIKEDLKRVEQLLYRIEYAEFKGLPLEEYLEELKTYKK
ncbi:MAG: SUKH-3 domain-containing protein [Sarcina sp.]